MRRIFQEISGESSSEDTPHSTVDECSKVPANVEVVVAEKRPKSKIAKRRERLKKKERGQRKSIRNEATSQEKREGFGDSSRCISPTNPKIPST